MSDAYTKLLDATIQHLEDLKAHGEKFVSASPDALKSLKAAPRAAAAKPPAPRAEPAPRSQPTSEPSAQPPVTPPATSSSAPAIRHSSLDIRHSPPPSPQPLDGEAKTAAFENLRRRVLACTRCPHLVAARKNVVFGVGSIDARLMFVGEAPGADEDEQGEPFVGKAGQLLTKIIQTMGLSRDVVYIGNILKCRPDTPGQSAGNRKPTSEEMKTCIDHLEAQIDVIRPEVLVALGATAVEGLLGKTIGITKLRGNWQSYRGIPLMPTYHPAYLLRNQALSEKRKVWEDMLAVMGKLGLSISEKQRRYFLPAP
jgi:DNA polymerase